MKTIEEIQLDVAAFSKKENGAFLSHVWTETRGKPEMGSLIPLMMMMGKVGNWFDAETTADQKKILGEVGVLLCDYYAREGSILEEPKLTPLPLRDDPLAILVMALGGLFSTTNKLHQGLIPRDDYNQERDAWVQMIQSALVEYAEVDFQEPYLVIVQDVWDSWTGRDR